MGETLLTAGGLQKLHDDLEQLRSRRRLVAEQLRGALAGGGELAENAEYLLAREEQAMLEHRIVVLEERLGDAEVVEPDLTDGKVEIGEEVRVRDLDSRDVLTYRIVGTVEADPEAGHISYKSPVGSALLGRHAGEIVELDVPSGRVRLEVLGVS
jgi:transcription elongation factor GreA